MRGEPRGTYFITRFEVLRAKNPHPTREYVCEVLAGATEQEAQRAVRGWYGARWNDTTQYRYERIV